MRTIKFRGKNRRNEIFYGDLLRVNGRAQIYDGNYHFVKDETVAQLIGVDKNGKEVYEGDKVKRILDMDYDGEWIRVDPAKAWEFEASFNDYSAILNEEIILVKAAGD